MAGALCLLAVSVLGAQGNAPADMKPAFLRFPGGNYLEGNTIATRFVQPESRRRGFSGYGAGHPHAGMAAAGAPRRRQRAAASDDTAATTAAATGAHAVL